MPNPLHAVSPSRSAPSAHPPPTTKNCFANDSPPSFSSFSSGATAARLRRPRPWLPPCAARRLAGGTVPPTCAGRWWPERRTPARQRAQVAAQVKISSSAVCRSGTKIDGAGEMSVVLRSVVIASSGVFVGWCTGRSVRRGARPVRARGKQFGGRDAMSDIAASTREPHVAAATDAGAMAGERGGGKLTPGDQHHVDIAVAGRSKRRSSKTQGRRTIKSKRRTHHALGKRASNAGREQRADSTKQSERILSLGWKFSLAPRCWALRCDAGFVLTGLTGWYCTVCRLTVEKHAVGVGGWRRLEVPFVF